MAAAAAAVKNPSSRSMTPPWPGMMLLGILGAEVPLDRGFEQIAGLRYHRQKPSATRTSIGATDKPERASPIRSARHDAAERSADRPGPGLLRADRRPELRPAERPAGEIGRDIGRPTPPQTGTAIADKAERRIAAQDQRRKQQHGRIADAGREPVDPRKPAKPAVDDEARPLPEHDRRRERPRRRRRPTRRARRRSAQAAPAPATR